MGLNALSILVIWVRYSDQIIVGRILFPLVINGLVIFYLMQPQVKEAFKR
jgi:hypothetical protein